MTRERVLELLRKKMSVDRQIEKIRQKLPDTEFMSGDTVTVTITYDINIIEDQLTIWERTL